MNMSDDCKILSLELFFSIFFRVKKKAKEKFLMNLHDQASNIHWVDSNADISIGRTE